MRMIMITVIVITKGDYNYDYREKSIITIMITIRAMIMIMITGYSLAVTVYIGFLHSAANMQGVISCSFMHHFIIYISRC